MREDGKARKYLLRGTIPLAAAVLFTANGPAVSLALAHETAAVSSEAMPLKEAKAKPLDTPASLLTTSSTALTATALSSGRHVFTHMVHSYPVTEPMPGAVTTPTIEYIEHLRFNDGAATFTLA